MTYTVAPRQHECAKQSLRCAAASRQLRELPMFTRKAILPDAEAIHDIIREFSGPGTLLPRSIAEICENIRDFVVVEDEEDGIIGCGALHLYGVHLAEIRSIAIWPHTRGRGGGRGRGGARGAGAGRRRGAGGGRGARGP